MFLAVNSPARLHHGDPTMWLRDLRERAQQWVKENEAQWQPPTGAYADLMFAFGLARLGESDHARGLLARATEVLSGRDDAHTFLLEAFRYRIMQALNGKPHTGSLPAERLDTLKGMVTLLNYVVDRLRRHSKILEPDQRMDPYRKWGARISELDNQLSELADLTDRKEIATRVQRLLKAAAKKGEEGLEARFKILKAALEAAPRVGEDFGREMLDLGQKAYDAMPEPADTNALTERAGFLEKALFVAAHFDSVGHIHQQVGRFEKMLQGQRGGQAIQALETLAGQCFRSLYQLDMRDQADRLLQQMADLVLEGKDLASVDAAGLRALLLLAGEWYSFGRDGQAEPVLQAARALLLKGDLPPREQTQLACAYARTVGQAPVMVARKRLEEIFTHVKGVEDTYTTSSHFSVSQLDLIEAVVLAAVERGGVAGRE
jgi:cellulose synthase operon protein C